MSDACDSLPEGWRVAPLGEVSPRIVDGSHNPPAKQDSGHPMLSAQNIENNRIVLGGHRYISAESFKTEDARTQVRPGDVLLTIVGTIGRSAVVPDGFGAFALQRSVAVLKPQSVKPKFLAYQLQGPVARAFFDKEARGTAQKGVYLKTLASMPILVAPTGLQERIVAEIEKQFTRLDAGVEALKRLQAHLRRYRAAVLKAACEGVLVPNEADLARREGRKFEPASALLLRAAKEREEYWARVGKGRRQPAAASLPPNLGALPEGWAWATFEQLSCRVTVGHVGPMKDEYVAEGVPFLRSQNVRENRFDPEGLLRIPRAFHERLSKSLLMPGDLCVVRSGSVGTTCVLPESVGEANCADLVLVQRPLGVLPRFAAYYMNSLAKARVRAGQVGIALTHFNTKSVAALPVPVPPMAEQVRIVDRVEAALSQIDAAEASVASSLARADQLRRAVLRAAFEGQLTANGGARSAREVE